MANREAMETQLVVCLQSGRVVARVELATGTWRRLVGLLGRRALPCGEGLLFRPCEAIHTFGMRFPIDLVALDSRGRVVSLTPGLPPWRLALVPNGAVALLELGAGSIRAASLEVGDIAMILEDREGICG